MSLLVKQIVLEEQSQDDSVLFVCHLTYWLTARIC